VVLLFVGFCFEDISDVVMGRTNAIN